MKTLEIRKSIVHWLLEEIAPWIIQHIFPPKNWEYTIDDYRNMPIGSLGNDLAIYLDNRNYDFLEGAQHHDIRHILLSYHMNIIDEVRMQVFMVGNGKWSFFSRILVLIGIFLLPEYWTLFREDYKRGKATQPIVKINWRTLLTKNTKSLRTQFNVPTIFFDSQLCNSKYFIDTIGHYVAKPS